MVAELKSTRARQLSDTWRCNVCWGRGCTYLEPQVVNVGHECCSSRAWRCCCHEKVEDVGALLSSLRPWAQYVQPPACSFNVFNNVKQNWLPMRANKNKGAATPLPPSQPAFLEAHAKRPLVCAAGASTCARLVAPQRCRRAREVLQCLPRLSCWPTHHLQSGDLVGYCTALVQRLAAVEEGAPPNAAPKGANRSRELPS